MSTLHSKKLEKYQLLFDGYIRDVISNMIIPADILELMFRFYFILNTWSEHYAATYVDIWENTTTEDAHSTIAIKGAGTVYSDNKVLIGTMHEWTIVMDEIRNRIHPEYGPWIGIIKNDAQILNHWKSGSAFWYLHHGYQFCCTSKTIRYGTKSDKYGTKCNKTGDVIIIRLDMIHFVLSFTINNIDYGVAVKDIEESTYRLALSVPQDFKHSRFQLI
eukprot:389881_1